MRVSRSTVHCSIFSPLSDVAGARPSKEMFTDINEDGAIGAIQAAST